ncbi:hypothetical protein C4K26_2249 [Pseudomonas chlororaphis]|nr:hypothetical protein C4K26_2249 [Pseudomonas chlororaphis]
MRNVAVFAAFVTGRLPSEPVRAAKPAGSPLAESSLIQL